MGGSRLALVEDSPADDGFKPTPSDPAGAHMVADIHLCCFFGVVVVAARAEIGTPATTSLASELTDEIAGETRRDARGGSLATMSRACDVPQPMVTATAWHVQHRREYLCRCRTSEVASTVRAHVAKLMIG